MYLSDLIIAIVFLIVLALFFLLYFKSWRKPKNVDGKLIVDFSDPDGPYMFMELDKSPYTLKGRSTVTLEVVQEDYLRENNTSYYG